MSSNQLVTNCRCLKHYKSRFRWGSHHLQHLRQSSSRRQRSMKCAQRSFGFWTITTFTIIPSSSMLSWKRNRLQNNWARWITWNQRRCKSRWFSRKELMSWISNSLLRSETSMGLTSRRNLLSSMLSTVVTRLHPSWLETYVTQGWSSSKFLAWVWNLSKEPPTLVKKYSKSKTKTWAQTT